MKIVLDHQSPIAQKKTNAGRQSNMLAHYLVILTMMQINDIVIYRLPLDEIEETFGPAAHTTGTLKVIVEPVRTAEL